MEALFTGPYTASAVENFQLKPVMVDDRMINVQIVKLQLKGVLLMCICNLSNVRIACISTDISKQSVV